MEAGRELDALVAERVMEDGPITWSRYGPAVQGPDFDPLNIDTYESPPLIECKPNDAGAEPHGKHAIPYYSTDIKAAWQVWEKMKMGHFYEFVAALQIITGCYGDVNLMLYNLNPYVICFAALKAMGIESGSTAPASRTPADGGEEGNCA